MKMAVRSTKDVWQTFRSRERMVDLMTAYDEVRYHGTVCVVEDTWDDDDQHHMITLRPKGDVEHGVYIVEESECQRV